MRRLPSILLSFLLPLVAVDAAAQPVVFDVSTNYLNDTLYVGQPAEIRFYVDAGPHEVESLCLSFRFQYTNGLAVDSFADGVNPLLSAYAQNTFASFSHFMRGDSVIIGGVSFGGPWEGSHLFTTILLQANDTGTITLDSIMMPPANHVSALGHNGADLPIEWHPGPIVVAPCSFKVGDMNGSNTLTLADIILLVNYVFKMGPPPSPHVSIGNVDAMGAITSSDIIFLVNHQGKGGPPPPRPCYNP